MQLERYKIAHIVKENRQNIVDLPFLITRGSRNDLESQTIEDGKWRENAVRKIREHAFGVGERTPRDCCSG